MGTLFDLRFASLGSVSDFHCFFLCVHRGMRAATMQAVMAATKRSMQLGDIPEEKIRHIHNL